MWIEAFFGHNHNVQAGDDLGRVQPKALAQDTLDAITGNGIADFFADGHTEPPGRVRIRSRQDEEQESLAMIAAACREAGREFPSRPEPVRRRKV
jgi:hypothetical protein